MIAINSKHKCHILDLDVNSTNFDADFLFVGITVYIPPNSSNETYIDYSNALENIFDKNSSPCIIIGDFNLPKITWSNDPVGLTILKSSNFIV